MIFLSFCIDFFSFIYNCIYSYLFVLPPVMKHCSGKLALKRAKRGCYVFRLFAKIDILYNSCCFHARERTLVSLPYRVLTSTINRILLCSAVTCEDVRSRTNSTVVTRCTDLVECVKFAQLENCCWHVLLPLLTWNLRTTKGKSKVTLQWHKSAHLIHMGFICF